MCGGAACLGVLSVRLSTPCRVYQARKNANEGKGDIVFKQLQYVPTCTHMVRRLTLARASKVLSRQKTHWQPTCKVKCEEPTFMWRKKAGR